jgi:hypothetical protein
VTHPQAPTKQRDDPQMSELMSMMKQMKNTIDESDRGRREDMDAFKKYVDNQSGTNQRLASELVASNNNKIGNVLIDVLSLLHPGQSEIIKNSLNDCFIRYSVTVPNTLPPSQAHPPPTTQVAHLIVQQQHPHSHQQALQQNVSHYSPAQQLNTAQFPQQQQQLLYPSGFQQQLLQTQQQPTTCHNTLANLNLLSNNNSGPTLTEISNKLNQNQHNGQY